MNLSPSPAATCTNARSPRILVPTDFSAESEAAVDYAVILARSLGAEVEVMHVWDLRATGTLGGRAVVMTPDAEMSDFGIAPGADGIKIRGRLEFGDVCETILRVADAEEFDLVVMGLHQRTRLAHWFGRRMTAKVRARSSCPLLTVRPGEKPIVPRTPESASRIVAAAPLLHAVANAPDESGDAPVVTTPPTSETHAVPPPAESSSSDATERDSRPSLPPMVSYALAQPH